MTPFYAKTMILQKETKEAKKAPRIPGLALLSLISSVPLNSPRL
jgi:hypothetical protein